MKKEINPAVFVIIIVVIVVGAASAYFMAGSSSSKVIDVSKDLDPKELRDDEPIRRGQPGYRERIDEK